MIYLLFYTYESAYPCRILLVKLKLHSTENPIYVFSDMKLYGLVSNSYIHVSVSNL
jgi:hypothetical protein